ncbi:MAG: 30S ribosomal protein S6 [Gemmatimonadota bacterium]
MPRKYEAVYIFDSTLEDSAIQEKIARHHALLGVAPENVSVDNWGRRQLAYKIGRRDTGYYALARFDCEPTALPEFERALRLDEGVVRYLITLHEHELGAPIVDPEALVGGRREEEEEDEE